MGHPNSRAVNLKGDNGGRYQLGAGALPAPAAEYPWYEAILAHAASVVTVTGPNITGTLTNVNLPAGFTWYGHFTAITVVSGEITAYNQS